MFNTTMEMFKIKQLEFLRQAAAYRLAKRAAQSQPRIRYQSWFNHLRKKIGLE
jgi:hypothetical protein